MRLIINGTPGPVILHNGYRIPQVFGGTSAGDGFQWPERTTPRTERPVRFSWHFDAHNGGKVQAWTEPYSWEV